MPKRVLIIGNGYLGSSIAFRLLDSDFLVTIYARKVATSDENLKSLGAEIYYPDKPERFWFLDNLNIQSIDALVSAVGIASPSFVEEHSSVAINFFSELQNFITTLVDRYRPLAVAYLSTGMVYGETLKTGAPETRGVDPRNLYAQLNVNLEDYLFELVKTFLMSIQIIRVANPYGTNQKFRLGQGLIPTLINRLQTGKQIDLYSNGEQIRDYIHIEDCCNGILKLITKPEITGYINLSTGIGTSSKEVLHILENQLDLQGNVNFLPSRASDLQVSVLKPEVLMRNFDWAPKALTSGLSQ